MAVLFVFVDSIKLIVVVGLLASHCSSDVDPRTCVLTGCVLAYVCLFMSATAYAIENTTRRYEIYSIATFANIQRAYGCKSDV
jgi:hypothetical protein